MTQSIISGVRAAKRSASLLSLAYGWWLDSDSEEEGEERKR